MKGVTDITRLYYEAVKDIPDTLKELDRNYLKITGHDLMGLACRAAGTQLEAARSQLEKVSAAVVPVSSGQGVIQGFSEAVKAILNHIGLRSFITMQTDIGGIGEAFAGKADLLFAADDTRFLAINRNSCSVVDNSFATAVGFVHALAAAAEKTSGGLTGADVLVIGLGPVGSAAAAEMLKLGAGVVVFDTDRARVQEFTNKFDHVLSADSLQEALNQVDYVFDATPAAGIIDKDLIRETMVISCPGVPHGLTPAAFEQIGSRLIHDVLPLGVATMAIRSLQPGD